MLLSLLVILSLGRIFMLSTVGNKISYNDIFEEETVLARSNLLFVIKRRPAKRNNMSMWINMSRIMKTMKNKNYKNNSSKGKYFNRRDHFKYGETSKANMGTKAHFPFGMIATRGLLMQL